MSADLELVSIKTNTYPLDGLLYTPRGARPRAAAMIFHGNCHNFYTGPSRFLPETLVADGIACLAFNRRGHEMVTSLDGRNVGGGAFQLAHEAIADGRSCLQASSPGAGSPIRSSSATAMAASWPHSTPPIIPIHPRSY